MNINDFTRWIERDFAAEVPRKYSDGTDHYFMKVLLRATPNLEYQIDVRWCPQRQPRSFLKVFVLHLRKPSFLKRLRCYVPVWYGDKTSPIYSGPLEEESYREAMRAIWKDLLDG